MLNLFNNFFYYNSIFEKFLLVFLYKSKEKQQREIVKQKNTFRLLQILNNIMK